MRKHPLTIAFLNLQARGGTSPPTGWSAETCVALHTFQRARTQPSGRESGSRIDLWLLHHFEAAPCWGTPPSPGTTQHKWDGPPGSNGIYSRKSLLSEVAARFAALGVDMTNATNPKFNVPAVRPYFGGGWIMGSKPLLGVLFEDIVRAYTFWMYGDLDGVFGATRDLFTWPQLRGYDYATGMSQQGRFDGAGNVRPACNRKVHASGPLQLFRSSARTRAFGRFLAEMWRDDLESGDGYGLEEYLGQASYHSSALLKVAANGSLDAFDQRRIPQRLRRIFFRPWLPHPPFRSPTGSFGCQAGQGGMGSQVRDVLLQNLWYAKMPRGGPGPGRWRRLLRTLRKPLLPIAISWSASRGLNIVQLTASGDADRFEARLVAAVAADEPLSDASRVHFLHFLWLKASVVRVELKHRLRGLAKELPWLSRFALLIRNETCKCFYVANGSAVWLSRSSSSRHRVRDVHYRVA